MVAQVALKRKFVPQNLDVADWSQLEPMYRALLDRPMVSLGDLQEWLTDFSEMCAAVDEYGARRYIEKSCHTEDDGIEKRFMHFIENIDPKIKPLFFELQKKFLESPFRQQLPEKPLILMAKRWQSDVDLFREENISIETEITKLVTEYDKISGAMVVEFDGRQQTLPQLARYGEETDRAKRQAAFEVAARRRMQDRDKIEKIFDEVLPLREKVARNAGMPDYRSFVWKAYKRFDYTPDDCLRFGDAIEKTVVPLVRQLDRKRMAEMKLPSLRPWDMSVDPLGRQPLRPFAESDIDGFVTKTKAIFARMSPALASDFETLRTHGNLDLESRKGKQPGGYQSSLDESQQPFIFMNAAGLQRDVETLLHEGGHAFHYLWACQNQPLVFLRSAPMEFCEVASMSMEALASDHMDVFYSDPSQAQRAKKAYFEGVMRFFPWMATIDTFQHWIYTHPNHTPGERTAYWLSLLERFGGLIDHSGYEDVKAASWQRQLHLFHAPFYYIEYGIAQIGALQMWMKAKEDPHRALSNYRAALALGGSRTLPELFAAAGLQFDFTSKTLEPLISAIAEELV